MSTAADIVRRSLRLMGVLKTGQEPKGADAEDGLERLQGLILSIPGLHMNGRWREVAVAAAYTSHEGDRCTVTAPGVVTLPTTITHHGKTRPPLELAKVQILGASATNAGLWLYSATKGAWGQADGLVLSDELPFGAEDDAGLAAQLAIDWVDEYGAEVSARTLALAQQSARSLRARLKKAEPEDHHRPGHHHPLCRDYY